MRAKGTGFADPTHPYRHQGSADLNLYKLFLEKAHALLGPQGRLGFLVPSGLYSDHGTQALRSLFLEHCRWEWLFGVENRDGIFPIHRSYKFNPIIVQKGGETDAINTAFMRRKLEDWERAEEVVTPYSRAQVDQFSPNSRAILEIQSARDLEILEKIYANGVLLGDDGPDGWGIKYATEFHMTNDSHLFPPRPEWEAKGYRPDEYSRWLLGDWRPMEELWEMLGVDPSKPEPAEIDLDDWLFDTTAGPERREAEAQFVHGHWLKPGDVARTDWKLRCAQPPYDRLPVARVRIPVGIVLSREADAWIREEDIEDVAFPFLEGRMVGPFDFSEKGWVRGKGRSSVWRDIPWIENQIEPQYLMGARDYRAQSSVADELKVAHMRIGSATNERTAIASITRGLPTGDTAATFYLSDSARCMALAAIINSLVFDFVTRLRVTGLHLDYHVWAQNPLPNPDSNTATMMAAVDAAKRLCRNRHWSVLPFIGLRPKSGNLDYRAVTTAERVRLTATLDALIASWVGLGYDDLRWILRDCDRDSPSARSGLDPKGFWRTDRRLDPHLRRTVLALVASRDLETAKKSTQGDGSGAIRSFVEQNEGSGWMLPEALQLAEYGLGDGDDGTHKPSTSALANQLGPRLYDWQLVQGADESRGECHIHARNTLGADQYSRLLTGLNRPHPLGASGQTKGVRHRPQRRWSVT